MCHRPNPLVEAFRLGLPERQRKHDEAVKELGRDPSKRRDRTDPEGGIPGRYGPGDVAGSMSRTQRRDVRAALAGLYSGPLRLPMPHYGEARLYCDMDGVAADFDRRYRDLFGQTRERHTDWDGRSQRPRLLPQDPGHEGLAASLGLHQTVQPHLPDRLVR
jgi:hypothetical protein